MTATIYSFGYKMNGEDQFATTGPNAPLIIDCRGLNNPHNDPEMRRMTGKDKKVQDMMLQSTKGHALLKRAVVYLTENPEGTVAFGCSYGKHRSVALAELTAHVLRDELGRTPFSHPVTVIHTGAAAKEKYA